MVWSHSGRMDGFCNPAGKPHREFESHSDLLENYDIS